MSLVASDEGSSGGRQQSFRKLQRSYTVDVAGNGASRVASRERTSQRSTSSRPLSQSLEDLVMCAICLEQLRRPTMLPCQHTFCLLCLQNYVRDSVFLITCPTCRKDCEIPAEGVRGLPTNIAVQAFLESLKQQATTAAATARTSPIEADGISVRKSGRCSRCAVNGSSKSPCPHCNQVFCSSCHVVHSNEQRNRWAALVDDLYAEEQRLALLTEEYKVRVEKLEHQIQMAAEIRVQRIIEDRDRLLSELKTWWGEEEVRTVELRQKCTEVLITGPKNVEETASLKEDFFSKTTALLETAHLLDSFRLTFDEEEFSLTKDDAESSRPKRVTIRIPPEEENGIQSVEAPQEAKKNEPPSTADEQSFFYRCKKNPRLRIAPSLLRRPSGVAVSPWTGHIYVAGTDSHRVYVMDRTGKIIKSLGSPYRSSSSTGSTSTGGTAHSSGHFLCPFGIAFSTAAEEIYVTDKWLNCIQVFSPDGNYLRQMGAKGTSPGHFRSPEGIAVDARGFIYVADTCNDRVQVLDRDGVFVRELGRVMQMTLPGGRLYQKREFNEPTGVAVSSSGDRIAVCDFGNCRIKVFGANGERLASFGFRGTQRGQFQKPECVVMDEMGFILVGDNGNGRIQIFRPNGNFVMSLGAKGNGAGQFNWISGLALTGEREIIATDFKNHCIQIF